MNPGRERAGRIHARTRTASAEKTGRRAGREMPVRAAVTMRSRPEGKRQKSRTGRAEKSRPETAAGKTGVRMTETIVGKMTGRTVGKMTGRTGVRMTATAAGKDQATKGKSRPARQKRERAQSR